MSIFPHEANSALLDRVAALRISTIDTHTAGEPLRIILGGTPLPDGANMLERWRNARGEWDRFRRLLMFEPRGHADMYGTLIVPPVSADALFGVLFMHNEGYSTGCGHGTIALAKVAVDLGWTRAVEPLTLIGIDAPSGLLKAYARVADGHATSSGFENVPSFASLINQSVSVPGIGNVHFDLGYGGAFYAFVDADVIQLELTAANARPIVEAGMAIKHAVAARFPVEHPEAPELSFLYGTILTSKPTKPGVHSRHVCVFADRALDRSPTGTGVAGRLAILRAKGELDVGQALAFEGITGECFTGRILRDFIYPNLAAVVTEIEGTAYITGRHEFILEKRDPLAEGFLVR